MKNYSSKIDFFIDPHYIIYLKYIIEAYDNVATITTKDSSIGLVSLSIASSCENLVFSIINDLIEKKIIIGDFIEEFNKN